MSDELLNKELLKNEDPEVEGHLLLNANDEPSDEAETEDEVEAHVRKASPRHI